MIVDFHTHISSHSLREQRETYVKRDRTFGELFADPKSKMATAEELIAAMDEDGVDRSVVMGIGWADIGIARETNDYVVDSVRRHPDRLVGFAGVNPGWGEAAAQEGVKITNPSETDPIVMLKHFGPENPDLALGTL